MTMNVDLVALSSAVQQANQDGAVIRGDTPTRKLPARRRSSLGGSSSTLQVLEAAQMSWSVAQEELPSGETTALQRRRSSRTGTSVKETLTEFGNKSLNVSGDGSLAKLYSTKRKLPKRRASMGSVMSSLDEEKPATQQSAVVKTTNRRGRLTRRSSIQPKDTKERKKRSSRSPSVKRSPSIKRSPSVRRTPSMGKTTSEEKKNLPIRRFVSDPTPPSPDVKATLRQRRSIDHSSSSMDDSSMSLSKSSKQSRRTSISKVTQAGKGSVRFELDHKNRIKRRVSFIRKQNSRTSDSTLWWSQEELDYIYERENKVYEKFADNKSYKRKIQKLWGSCSKASSGNQLTPEVLAHVAGSPCRGLEVDILETVRDRRARVIGSVLDAQEDLKNFDPNIRTKVLSARYKNLCKAATRFSRKMAEGDEMEAANVYKPNEAAATTTPQMTKE